MSGDGGGWQYSSYDDPITGRCGICKLIINSNGYCSAGCIGINKRFSIGREQGTSEVE
jgi:hypothetical protein